MTTRARPNLRALFVPIGSVGLLLAMLALVLGTAGATLGYDYHCYEGAAQAFRDGLPMYNVAFSVDVGKCPGTYTYPPVFALALVPWLSLGGAAAGLWCLAMAACFLAGVALLPVRNDVRWLIVIVAAMDWSLLYAVKLGQVEPILFLLFAATWRWLDRPWAVGVATALGTLLKVQPAAVGIWAAATGRWRAVAIAAGVVAAGVAVSVLIAGAAAWTTYVDLLRALGGKLTTPHNFAPGAVAYQAGLPLDVASAIQLASVAVAAAVLLAALRYAPHDLSLQITIVASQLLSSPLRDHYAVLLLLPTAWLLQRGKAWAVVFPLAGWLSLFAFKGDELNSWPAAASVPLVFFGLLAVLAWEVVQARRVEVSPETRAVGGARMSALLHGAADLLDRLGAVPDRVAAALTARIPMRIRRPFGRQIDWRVPAGLLVAVVLGLILLQTTGFDAGRPDVYYLSDAFLHGKTSLPEPMGPWDVIPWQGVYYLPFPPFPSILFMPLMVLISPETARGYEPVINCSLAALDVALLWWLAARIGVERIRDRVWLAILLALGTDLWWVVVRGGVWHTGHLVATMLTLMALIECFGRRRPLLIGLLAGAAFLTRPPVAFAVLFYAYMLTRDRSVKTGAGRRAIARDWFVLGLGILPSIAFFFWYNQIRFGSPLQSGYELALLPMWLEEVRAQGLFSLSHLGRNWDYFALRLPELYPSWPFFKPNSQGNSILFTSPALLLALRNNWRSALPWALALGFVAVLLPNLLYYGGGWFQFGFRYALDAVPFLLVLCALALRRRSAGLFWWGVLAVCVWINAGGAWWAYQGF